MNPPKKEQLPAQDQRARGPASNDAGQAPAAEKTRELWAEYTADRRNLQLRNRLVEHYLPRVARMAASLAKELRVRDRDGAVGEVLAGLVASIVPGYDGKSGFHRWAYACAKRKLLNLRRGERRTERIFAAEPSGGNKLAFLENVPERTPYDGGKRRFVRLTAELSDRQAVVLWLRGYCGLSVKAVARLLKLSPRCVEARTRSAVEKIRKN